MGPPLWAATGNACVAAVILWQAIDAQRRRLSHWGLETAASATGTQGACDAASGALADKMPLRKASGGDRSGPDAGGVREACDRHRPQGLPRVRS